MQDKAKTYHFCAFIAAPKIHTDLLWDLTLLFFGLCILYFAVIFFFRRKLTIGSKKVRARKKELSPMISQFLFYDENDPKEEKTNYVNLKIEIRELLNNAQNRKVLIDILMDLRKDLSGSTLLKLFELYKGLDLHHDSYKKLESWRWQAISKGILELTQMHVEESFGFISKFINNRNSTIRKQAEIAIVTLKHEGINYFLDTTTYKISEWQQLKFLEVLKDKSDFQPPSFKYWLISKNKDVVLFAVRLMKYYNQSDGNQALIELLKHKNGEIKTAAINCIKEFNVVDSLETLKLVFWNSSVDIKINILDAISTLGTTTDLEFLNSIGVKDSNFNVKSKALATINAIAPMTVMPTKDIQNAGKFKVPEDIPTEKPQDFEAPLAAKEKLPEPKTPENQITESTNESGIEDFEKVDQAIEEKTISEPPIKHSKKEPEFEDSFKSDFLPIVTEKPIKPSSDRYHPKNEPIDFVEDLSKLKVIFSTVPYDSVNEDKVSGSKTISSSEKILPHSFKSESLDFLPIVVASEKEALEVSDISVVYSEVNIETTEPKENKILSELHALIPLPKPPTINRNSKIKVNVDQSIKQSSSINTIDMKKVKEIECKGVEIKTDNQKVIQEEEPVFESAIRQEEPIHTDNSKENALDWIRQLNEAQMELKQKIKSIVTKQEVSSLKLPKPIFYTTHEANMVALLDDIEALGDQREVPLLQDLLTEKENSFVHERILFLIEKISDTEVLKKELPAPNHSNEAGFSVFQEFFKTADTESKLILLDEIVAIGDEKEVGFLNQLVRNAEPKVMKKAKVCLRGLQTKLAQEQKSSQKDSVKDHKEADQVPEETPKLFDVFDIDFELAPSENNN